MKRVVLLLVWLAFIAGCAPQRGVITGECIGKHFEPSSRSRNAIGYVALEQSGGVITTLEVRGADYCAFRLHHRYRVRWEDISLNLVEIRDLEGKHD